MSTERVTQSALRSQPPFSHSCFHSHLASLQQRREALFLALPPSSILLTQLLQCVPVLRSPAPCATQTRCRFIFPECVPLTQPFNARSPCRPSSWFMASLPRRPHIATFSIDQTLVRSILFNSFPTSPANSLPNPGLVASLSSESRKVCS